MSVAYYITLFYNLPLTRIIIYQIQLPTLLRYYIHFSLSSVQNKTFIFPCLHILYYNSMLIDTNKLSLACGGQSVRDLFCANSSIFARELDTTYL